MGMLKPWHIIVLVIVILLLFGARRLPDLARSVGQSLKIFKSEVKDLTDDGKLNDSNEPPADPTAQTPTRPVAGSATPPTAAPPAAGAGQEHIPGLIDPNHPRG
ncbi:MULTISPECIES: Sec-independent protein translocase subunit TatA [unclassified Isoptericola]|uniref:Sec-independent protein translocase subunit TatA n=1 Tax=Isoptericola sp. NPDC057191 TaxID=3346041 RepID=UPI00363D5397